MAMGEGHRDALPWTIESGFGGQHVDQGIEQRRRNRRVARAARRLAPDACAPERSLRRDDISPGIPPHPAERRPRRRPSAPLPPMVDWSAGAARARRSPGRTPPVSMPCSCITALRSSAVETHRRDRRELFLGHGCPATCFTSACDLDCRGRGAAGHAAIGLPEWQQVLSLLRGHDLVGALQLERADHQLSSPPAETPRLAVALLVAVLTAERLRAAPRQ